MKLRQILIVGFVVLTSCYPQPGPDKSVAGAVLGAGWGAGAGAIIGNNIGAQPEGIAIGAGFGAASGLLQGIAYDMAEGADLEHERQLDALRVQVAANQRDLLALQTSLDQREQKLAQTSSGDFQVFFDPDTASLKLGSAAELERFANTIKSQPFMGHVIIHGHSDDTGDADRNERLSEARARSVATFLVNHGVSLDQIETVAHGSKRPVATNESEIGRQLNRRVEIVLAK